MKESKARQLVSAMSGKELRGMWLYYIENIASRSDGEPLDDRDTATVAILGLWLVLVSMDRDALYKSINSVDRRDGTKITPAEIANDLQNWQDAFHRVADFFDRPVN